MLVGWVSVDVGRERQMYLGISWKENPYLNVVLWLEESMGVQWRKQIRVQAYGLVTSMRVVEVQFTTKY